ncbi:probable 39S ribosomal protein L24, mitochondrial [Pararge aegeria]|uniref:Large ribosomal subunit protein uL24m n=1 Tax=Pararge aegeria aegeria TaxID=348720 RepID=A0A8S4R2L8_9NEOP|nr:probable 39S ribosomal protein L24, mitochondrial [Pararge aegeria]CAH2229009.1 jg7080 [Pararge aegeria aegeria]
MRIYNFLCKKVGELTVKYSNLPESYIKRSYEQVYWRNPKGYPQYPAAQIARKKFRFTTNRPWTMQFARQNERTTYRKKVFLEPIGDWMFFKGDRVEILVGKDKGKQGIVSQVIQERNWVFVEGLNTHLRIVGKDKQFPGITIQSEAPLLVTTGVKLVDPETLKATEVEWRYTEEGEKVRVSVSSSRIIPVPKAAQETVDYKSRELYVENEEKDTTAAVANKITYDPKLCTFEMDIMESMGIKEDRVPAKSYWY